jgi:flagellar biosynthesis/type III secretory pathway M-ring protein FliF/YscJ
MQTGVKIALWVTGIAVVGVGGFFIWKSVTKKREEKAAEEKANEIKDASNLAKLGYNPNDPLGLGKKSGGLNNISLYDREAFKKSMNQFPKTYDPNFLANQRPLVTKPFSI